MVDLPDRKKAMEEKYFRDAEQAFKLTSRSDRLLAKWIAELTARADFAAYSDEITDARYKGGGEAGVLRKALADLHAAGCKFTENDVTAKMRALKDEAAEQLKESE